MINFKEEDKRGLYNINERIHSMDFSKLDPVVRVYQTGPKSARIVCEQDLFICDIEIRDFDIKVSHEVGYIVVYKPYIDGIAEDEYVSSFKNDTWARPGCAGDSITNSVVMNALNYQVKNDIAMFAYSYYDMYRSKIEAAVKRKRLMEVAMNARVDFVPEVEPIKRREM